MARDAFEQFRSLVLADISLQKRLRDVTEPKLFREAAVKLGEELGFRFDEETVEQARRAGHRAWLERGTWS